MNSLARVVNAITDAISSASRSTQGPAPFYHPSPSDTVLVRSYLVHLELPIELALIIIDYAQYYPIVRGHTDVEIRVSASRFQENSAATLCVVSDPIPAVLDGVRIKRKIATFKMRSHDQGWGGDAGCQGEAPFRTISDSPYVPCCVYPPPRTALPSSLPTTPRTRPGPPLIPTPGTYSGSYTWFEASILRPSSPIVPPLPIPPYLAVSANQIRNSLARYNYTVLTPWLVQRNMTASREEREHEVEWRSDRLSEPAPGAGDRKRFCEELRPGDRVGLWARAMFPGWENYVKEAMVEVVLEID
jgi:hypothetical protein